MKHYRIKLKDRPKEAIRYGSTVKRIIFWPFKTLPLITAALFPTLLLIGLIIFGIPGLLVHEDPFGCYYQDMIGTYPKMPYRSERRCNYVSFRTIALHS